MFEVEVEVAPQKIVNTELKIQLAKEKLLMLETLYSLECIAKIHRDNSVQGICNTLSVIIEEDKNGFHMEKWQIKFLLWASKGREGHSLPKFAKKELVRIAKFLCAKFEFYDLD